MINIEIAAELRARAEQRDRRLKYSVSSSLVSKLGTAAVQLLALPIAIRALGAERFSIYVVLASAVSWIGIANLGVGPYLAIRLAAAAAREDRETQKRLVASAFFPIVFAACGLCAVVLLSQQGGPVQRFTLGGGHASAEATRTAGLTLVALVIVQVLIGVFEAAQLGYQEQYLANLFNVAGNVCCFVALLCVAHASPSILGMVLAINAPLILAKAANVSYFLWGRRYLLPSVRSLSWMTSKQLISGGAAISLISIGSFSVNQYPVIIVGRLCDSHTTATIAASINMFVLLMGILSMTAAPLSPAISESVERGDLVWVKRAYRRLVIVWLLYALPVSCLIAFVGATALLLWFGANVTPSGALMKWLAVYFFVSAWEHINYHFLLGLKHVWLPAILFCARSVGGVMVARLLLQQWGGPGVFMALAGAALLLTAVPFGYYCRRTIQQLSSTTEVYGASFVTSSQAV
jgi:O-antigen/teichoic acid export membrane protein